MFGDIEDNNDIAFTVASTKKTIQLDYLFITVSLKISISSFIFKAYKLDNEGNMCNKGINMTSKPSKPLQGEQYCYVVRANINFQYLYEEGKTNVNVDEGSLTYVPDLELLS